MTDFFRGDFMRNYKKLAISMPVDMLEILDMYAEYEGLTRSGAIAYLLAKGLAFESAHSNSFDFDTILDISLSEDGEEVVLRRSDLQDTMVEWTFGLGQNRRKEYIIVSSKDFENIDKEQE